MKIQIASHWDLACKKNINNSKSYGIHKNLYLYNFPETDKTVACDIHANFDVPVVPDVNAMNAANSMPLIIGGL